MPWTSKVWLVALGLWRLWDGRLNRWRLFLTVDSRQRSPSCFWQSVCSLFQWWCHCVLRWSSCRVQTQAVVHLQAQDGLDSHLVESSFKKAKPFCRHFFSTSLNTPLHPLLPVSASVLRHFLSWVSLLLSYANWSLVNIVALVFTEQLFTLEPYPHYHTRSWYQEYNRVQEKAVHKFRDSWTSSTTSGST